MSSTINKMSVTAPTPMYTPHPLPSSDSPCTCFPRKAPNPGTDVSLPYATQPPCHPNPEWPTPIGLYSIVLERWISAQSQRPSPAVLPDDLDRRSRRTH